MSISFCKECDHVVEGNTHEFANKYTGEKYTACDYCGTQVSELPEDDPREDR